MDPLRSRVVLIGTSNFELAGMSDLPAVANNVHELARHLAGRDGVFAPESVTKLLDESPGRVGQRVEDAAGEADDVLIVYYAGHAEPRGESDLLLVNGASEHPTYESMLLSELRDAIRRSRARRRFLLLDCCFAGTAAELGPIGPQLGKGDGWATIMSSTLDKPSGDNDAWGYTAFTGRLIERMRSGVAGVLGEPAPEHLSLASLYDFASESLSGLQVPQWNGSKDIDVPVVRNSAWQPGPDRELRNAWIKATKNVLDASQSTTSGHREVLRPIIELLATDHSARTSVDRTSLSPADQDPWRSEDFAKRMSEQTAELLASTSTQLELSPTETFALAVMPFVYAVWWDRSLAQVPDLFAEEPGADAAVRAFRKKYEQTVQRTQGLESDPKHADAATTLRWWLKRRWAAEQELKRNEPACVLRVISDEMADSAPLDGFGIAPEDLYALLRYHLIPLVVEPDPRRLQASSLPWDMRWEHRGESIIKVLVVSQQMAIDPIKASRILAHVAAGDSFGPAEIVRHRVRWRLAPGDGGPRVYEMVVSCESPEALAVFRAHCGALDDYVMRASSRDQGERFPIGDVLPARFTSISAQPAETEDGSFDPVEMRFTLDEERVRELLMGAELYQHAGIAFRELYQNALDACRHRAKRIAYLNRKNGTSHEPRIRIVFRDGVEGGRKYVECQDDGVGLGERELEQYFGRGGGRFATSQEYLEEQAAWETEGITSTPNSMFGIGVFSYFMVAEEIEVTTSRYERDGQTGSALRVNIRGPGALFRISKATRAGAGTTVRLYLKPLVDVEPYTKVLRRWVWCSDFDVMLEAAPSKEHHLLRAGALSEVAPIGADKADIRASDTTGNVERKRNLQIVQEKSQFVWWCNGIGWALRDGVWFDHVVSGAVVNLTGELAPALSVDRNRARDHDAVNDIIDQVLIGDIDTLFNGAREILSNGWVGEVTRSRPRVADAIFERALSECASWMLFNQEVDIRTVGCFGLEATFQYGQSRFRKAMPSLSKAVSQVEDMDARVVEWRARAWIEAGMVPGLRLSDRRPILVARPSDVFLFGLGRERGNDPDIDYIRDVPDVLRTEDVMKRAWEAEIPYATAMDRFRAVGWDVSRAAPVVPSFDAADVELLLWRIDRVRSSLLNLYPLTIDDLVDSAIGSDLGLNEAVSRFARFGFCIPEIPAPVSAASRDDLIVFGTLLDLFDPRMDVRLDQVARAAAQTGRTASEIVEKLALLGYPTMVLPDGFEIDQADRAILEVHWVRTAQVTLGRVVSIASTTEMRVADVAQRLTKLGFDVPPIPSGLRVHVNDDEILPSAMEESAWLARSKGVPLARIVQAALQCDLLPEDVVARLDELGYATPTLPQGIDLGAADKVLLSNGLDRGSLLDPDDVVPLRHFVRGVSRGFTVEFIAARLAELGYRVPSIWQGLYKIDSGDLLMLHSLLEREDKRTGNQLRLMDVVRVIAETGMLAVDVCERLKALGFELPDGLEFVETDR
ncbi:caspase, EACC1-associated type [Promicromonospora sp. CA-289599]|uniref:caspase, EACC1-associated type n=1 Tax=Promicromonospora sp. CA-289599 TaxID=3240014 RepID=UPI003D8A6AF3